MDLMLEYRTFLSGEKHSSDNTVSSYLRDLRQYLRWLESEELTPEKAAQADVERYTRYLLSLGKSVATATRALAALKSFYTYLMSVGAVSPKSRQGAGAGEGGA